MTRADRLLIAAIAIVALLAWPLVALASDQGDRDVIIVGPAGTSVLPLGSDATLAVEGHMGTVTVRVAGGSVCVLDSCCPNQVCVRTGRARAAGSVIACVPNGVTVRIGGRDRAGFDARIR